MNTIIVRSLSIYWVCMCYYQSIANMVSISLIIIGVISLLVIGGAVYLFLSKDQELNDGKKSLILLAIGVVIFLSFLVTTFKHRNLGLRSSSAEDGVFDVKKVFFRGNCDFEIEHKYPSLFEISNEDVEQMYNRNYLSLYDYQEEGSDIDSFKEKYQQTLLFLSKKDQGATRFLNNMAYQTCSDRKTPVIYLKLERQINKQDQFLKKVGVYSFEQLQKSYCHFSKVDITVNAFNQIQYVSHLSSKRVAPYLIIDNFEHLLGTLAEPSHFSPFHGQNGQEYTQGDPLYNQDTKNIKYNGRKRLFQKILKELLFNCRINIILNTEKQQAIEELYNIWEDSHLYKELKIAKGGKQVPFPFEFHRWEGLKQYDLFKTISANFPSSNNQLSKLLQINKQDSYTFKDLYHLVEQLKKKTSGQKTQKLKEGGNFNQDDLKLSVARYFQLSESYQTIKRASNKKISSLKENVSYDDLIRLESLGLAVIRQGKVYLR